VPNFQSNVAIVPTGKSGGAIQWQDDGYVAWRAPGNIYAQRGTLSFFWRPRTPVGEAPFVIFRVGFRRSFELGHGVPADRLERARLRRLRHRREPRAQPGVVPDRPAARARPVEAYRLRLGRGGRRAAVRRRQGSRAQGRQGDLDAGLDQFGLAGRIISPHQVQSRYNFMRGSDVDEIRVYDRMLGAAMWQRWPTIASRPGTRRGRASRCVAAPLRLGRGIAAGADRRRHRIRKVEFADAKDLKEWMWKGVDGIAETTWPGVYNRSRLPGRRRLFRAARLEHLCRRRQGL
jgi:hypothetical protein